MCSTITILASLARTLLPTKTINAILCFHKHHALQLLQLLQFIFNFHQIKDTFAKNERD